MTPDRNIELHPEYRPDIDGLRAIAVLSVVGYHAFPMIIKGGFIGVDIFFVISGYLISSIIFINLEHNSFSLIGFYKRRIKRIFPALIAVMLTLLVIGRFLLPIDNYAQLGKHTLSGAGFFSNFTLYKESGYFDTKASTKPLLHLWSLAIEEQFYILWPLLLLFVWRRRWNFLFITNFIAIFSFIVSLILWLKKPEAAFYYPIARFWELMIGGILAYIALHKPRLLNKFRNTRATLGLVLFLIGLLLVDKNLYFLNLWMLLPTVSAFLLISSGQNSWFNKFFLSHKILVWVGLISYPLYLWHWPLLSLLYIIERGNIPIHLRLMAVILSIVLASLTYYGIEKPIRYGKNTNFKVLILTSLMLILGITGNYIFVNKGLNRYVYNNQNLNDKTLAAGIISDYLDKNDWSKSKPPKRCAQKYLSISTDCISISDAPPSIVLIGDSHTQELYPGLVDLIGDHEGNIMRFGTYLPFYDTAVKLDSKSHEIGPTDTNKELDFAISSPSVKTIIISFRGIRMLTGTDYNSLKPEPIEGMSFRIIGNNSTNLHHTFEMAMQNTLTQLTRSDKKIIFVIDKPELGFDPADCFDLIPVHLNKNLVKNPCAIPRKAYDQRSQEYRTLIYSILKDYPQIQIFDPALLLCDDKWCWAMKDGKVLYQDNNHLSIDGSRYIGKYLIKYIK